jgi:TetR/AcrR family transcriptional regulator, transcriptional repressor of bet genes
MPKIGMQAIRKRELIEAAIAAIHARGSLEVTVSEIARRAGVSQGLAHHYFGSKEQLIVSAMRHLLHEFGAAIRVALRRAGGPRDRVSAIIHCSLGPEQFAPETVTAWLIFYVHAQRSAEARRLLSVYTARLNSNLRHAIRPLVGERAPEVAEAISALIDGFYIRNALSTEPRSDRLAIDLTEEYVDLQIGKIGSAAAGRRRQIGRK